MAASDVFTHEPLRSPDRQIRLLEVRGSDRGVTEYCLTEYILGSGHIPRFYALSYEWGTDSPSHVIHIDGKIFKIRDNLKLFLDRISNGFEDFIRPMWIDAICINQDNNAERNAQVKIMGNIFSAATLVLTWLGPQTVENGALGEIEVNLREWKKSEEYTRLRAGTLDQRPSIMTLREPYGAMWNRLQLLSTQSFFQRLWILQELIKAENILLLWGVEQITWSALTVAFRTIYEAGRGRRLSAQIQGPWDVVALSVPFSIWLHVEGLHIQHRLLQAMETYRESKCSVFHDKAYALTGISADSDLLQIEYEKSLPDLYADLMGLEPRTPYCLKYSHLVLDALRISQSDWDNSPVKGRIVTCEGEKVGPVIAATEVCKPITNTVIETEILQMFSLAGRSNIDQVNDAVDWSQKTYAELCAKIARINMISLFLMLDGRFGMALCIVRAGDLVYCVKGLDDEHNNIHLRQPNDTTISIAPLTVASSSTEVVCSQIDRVWLSEPSHNACEDLLVLDDSMEITLGELYDMNRLLGIEINTNVAPVSPTEAPSSPQLETRRTQSDTAEVKRPHRASTVSQSIDQAMSFPFRSATWPASPVVAESADGWYIDALARRMRDQLFAGSSILNTPD